MMMMMMMILSTAFGRFLFFFFLFGFKKKKFSAKGSFYKYISKRKGKLCKEKKPLKFRVD